MATQRVFYVEDEASVQIAINKAWIAGGGAVSDPETYPRVIPPALYQWIQALRAA